jgi:hypothetical protein
MNRPKSAAPEGRLLTLAVQKLKNRNATKNDIFQFDLQVETACALSD